MAKKNLNIFLLAVCAGIAISIGGTVYLSTDNKIAASLLFTVGLYMIVQNGLYLYTGKIGYLPEEDDKSAYLRLLLLTWLGNLTGTWGCAMLLKLTKLAALSDAAAAASSAKLVQSPLSALILSIFCGVLMYTAVDGFKGSKNPLILFICVSVFILCGFEHCVANMFYFSMGGAWSVRSFFYILLMTLGNSLGGMVIPSVKRIN